MNEPQKLDFLTAAKAIEQGKNLHEVAGLSRDFIRLLYATAVGQYESGQYIDALESLHQLTVLDARNADNWALLGNCLLRMGMFSEAVTAWRVALSAAPSFATAATVTRTAVALKNKEASAEGLIVARLHRKTPEQFAEYEALLDSWNLMAGAAAD
jgi:tetratricopeptide (TPR) repeat protein